MRNKTPYLIIIFCSLNYDSQHIHHNNKKDRRQEITLSQTLSYLEIYCMELNFILSYHLSWEVPDKDTRGKLSLFFLMHKTEL
jgi:hypothetical protein